MDVVKAVQHYINRMLSDVSGMKILLLDGETVRSCQLIQHLIMFMK